MAEHQIHDVGPVYAVRDYMRRLDAVCRIPLHEEGEWYNLLLGLAAGSPARCHREFRDSLRNGMTSQRMLSVTEKQTRRLGHPATEFVMLRAGVGEVKHLGGMRTVPGVYVCRDYVRLERDRAEYVSSLPFVFFSNHALERIHQRERCVTGGIDETMRERLVSADGDLAFAAIAGLVVPGDGGVSHQLVPFGDGLLVATIVSYVKPSNQPVPMVTRQLLRRKVIDARHMPIRRELVGTLPEGLAGHCSQVLTIARTYLSSEMLRPEQEEYRRLFMDEAAALDRQRLAAALHMPVAAHERRELDGISASPLLHALLARSINPEHYPAIWEAAESKKDPNPPRDEHGRSLFKLRRHHGEEVEDADPRQASRAPNPWGRERARR